MELKTTIILGIIGGCVILLVILVASSFDSLELNEIGLKYNSFDMSISPMTYTGGLYWVGPFGSFIDFPKTFQNVEFSDDRTADRPAIYSRTSDGLEVMLEISFQFTLIVEGIH